MEQRSSMSRLVAAHWQNHVCPLNISMLMHFCDTFILALGAHLPKPCFRHMGQVQVADPSRSQQWRC